MSDSPDRLDQLEEKIAVLRAEYAGSWALRTRDDFELGFVKEIKAELLGTMFKWALGTVVLLLGSGALFIKYTVIQTFREENDQLVHEIQKNTDRQVDLMNSSYEWRRYHDYGKDYIYLAGLYFDSPLDTTVKARKVASNLDEAEGYFNKALRQEGAHASTYWELGELYFGYPLRYDVPQRMDLRKAISYYKNAIDRYGQAEIRNGWRAQCYLRLAEAHGKLLEKSAGQSQVDWEDTKAALEKANQDFSDLEDQAEHKDDIQRVRDLLLSMPTPPGASRANSRNPV